MVVRDGDKRYTCEILVSGINLGQLKKSRKDPCGVCKTDVSSDTMHSLWWLQGLDVALKVSCALTLSSDALSKALDL